jgi:hypothetical protein
MRIRDGKNSDPGYTSQIRNTDFYLGILEVGGETEMEEARDCVSQGVHPRYEGFSIHHEVQEDLSAKKI